MGSFSLPWRSRTSLVKPLRFPDRGPALPLAVVNARHGLPCKFSNIQTFKSLYTQTFGLSV